ncbi:permease for cytosine/purines, uracil, thiamine, allantoin-domain-containing protein [Dipodascopsis tothii]|uniref:permease for cytosine/purines, uracil, thiamine, allantoin-domain-containing protein n=1 Tax=Dipodascopsis tothii TaxID=44089 RepID=UPI0034CE207F
MCQLRCGLAASTPNNEYTHVISVWESKFDFRCASDKLFRRKFSGGHLIRLFRERKHGSATLLAAGKLQQSASLQKSPASAWALVKPLFLNSDIQIRLVGSLVWTSIQNPLHIFFKMGFLSRLQLDSHSDARRSNADLDPVPPAKRTWRTYNYVLYWISDNMSVAAFRNASSLMEAGLSWKMSLISVTLSQVVVGLAIVLNGVFGSTYRVSFTMQARASYGYYFSIVMILMRMIVGIFWYGIQAYTGGECVRTMLYAIWPSFRNIPEHLPVSSNTTTTFLVSYAIYFILVVPLHLIPIHKLQWLFIVKAISTPIVGLAMMGWMIKTVGLNNSSVFSAGNTIHGSALAWEFLNGMYANIGTWSTLAVNCPDFTRYAKSNRSPYITLLVMPATGCFMTFIGVVLASGSNLLYGEIKWDPLLICDEWTSKGGRAAAFFCGFFLLLAQVSVNIAANSVSAANDMNCLWPRYINIRRGQIIVATLGSWALTPWNILTSGSAFLSFMSGYSVWLGPMVGVLISDFYLVHKKKYNVWELYDLNGIYRYNRWGTNWRAAVAFTCGWVPLLPGFIPTINSKINVAEGMTDLYYIGYFWGTLVTAFIYWLLCYLWPAKETMLEVAVLPDDDMVIHADGEDSAEISSDYELRNRSVEKTES